MTSAYIKNKVHKLSLETGVNPNIILRHFIFEFFLEKLDKSKYCSQFVIKGGFLISSWISIDHRTTMDLDLNVKSFLLTKENLRLSIHEILTIETIQDLTMALVDIEEIRENDQYPGFRATIMVLLDGLRERIKIDFTTGDLITPSPIIYHYRKILDQNVLKLHTYNFETVISEKMETILSRGIFNTRLRDFYDVFTIWNLMRKDIVIDTLKHAFENTSLYRNNKKFKLEEVLQRIDMLETDNKIIEQ
jgi:predicted nucleotidyltransferase component of viral defense system